MRIPQFACSAFSNQSQNLGSKFSKGRDVQTRDSSRLLSKETPRPDQTQLTPVPACDSMKFAPLNCRSVQVRSKFKENNLIPTSEEFGDWTPRGLLPTK